MPVRKRNDKRRGPLEPNQEAWLRGEAAGFIAYQSTETLEALWDAHGDKDRFYWDRSMFLPEPIE